jgi:PST family polysaccharide transporter
MYLSQDLTGAQLKQFLVTRPLMVLVIVAGTPWGAVGVAAGHSVAYALYWVASLWHVGRVSGVDTGPLLRNATRVLLTVSAPCGVLALAATWLPVPAALQVVVGLLAAAAWLGLLVAVVPAVRADAATVRSFALRAAGRRRAA